MELIITASIGITTCPLDGRSSQLIQHADKAMYDAKMAGKTVSAFIMPNKKKAQNYPNVTT